MNAFFAALQFLTLFPRPGWMQHSANEVGRSAIFFPVVGLILGLILVLVNFLLLPFASAGLLSVILVTLLAFMTRGLHLDGVGDTFDGLGAGGDREPCLASWTTATPESLVSSRLFWCCFLKSTPSRAWTVDRWRALLVAPDPRALGDGAIGLSLQGGQSGTGFEFNRSPDRRSILSSPLC